MGEEAEAVLIDMNWVRGLPAAIMIVRINRGTKSNLAGRPTTVKALLQIFVA